APAGSSGNKSFSESIRLRQALSYRGKGRYLTDVRCRKETDKDGHGKSIEGTRLSFDTLNHHRCATEAIGKDKDEIWRPTLYSRYRQLAFGRRRELIST